jgi:hypothetical protein
LDDAMGFLDRLLGRPEPSRPQRYRTPPATGSWDGGDRRRTGQEEADERAIARYRYLLRTAPPETIEQAHAEAFAQLTPEQRRQVLTGLADDLPATERSTGDDPRSLARMATRAEMRRPGTLERVFGGPRGGLGMGGGLGGFGGGIGGGMGVGGMIAGTLLASIAGTVIGSSIASAFLDDNYDDSSDNDADGGDNDGGNDGGDASDGSSDGSDAADGSGDDGSVEAAGDFGGGGFGESPGGGYGGDYGGGFGGDFGGGDFGGGDFGGGDF